MLSSQVLDLYRESGALKEGHFRLSSGLHSDKYFQSALVLAQPRFAARLGAALASRFKADDVDVVIGPAMGAIIIAHEVGRALDRPVLFAERVDDRFALRRGFAVHAGERALLVEDVLTTGGSILELASVIESSGAKVVALGCLVDRRGKGHPISPPLESLAQVEVPTWKPDACPRCLAGAPMDVPGSRKRQLA